ncbi:MAG: S8 family serine peptidase, partial [Flavobacteriaceae bacterium]
MKSSLYILLIGWSFFSFGQTEDAFVYFNNKPDAQYFLDNPLEMLSQRALERRQNQNISLDFTDAPLYAPYVTQVGSSVLVLAHSKWLNAVYVRGDYQDILDLEDFTFVESIEFANKNLNPQSKKPSEKQKSVRIQKPLDTQENFLYGDSANQIQLHNGEFLHQQGFTGAGKIIAVLDTGFEGVNTTLPFQRLFNQNLILGGYNFVLRNDEIYTGGNHGTRVLSVMGGYRENELVGTAPDAAFYLFVTEDTTSESPLEEALWVEAAEMADSLGVDIINTSLGYDTFDNPAHNHSYEDLDGITTFISKGLNIAYSKGILCVTSAGNSGNSDWLYVSTPADAQGSLTVGAVTSEGEYAWFSSVGPTFDQRIKPDVTAQ